MKNLSKGLVVLFIALASSTAQAEVTRLGIRFAGGCFTKNSQGSCTIDTVAFGDGFEAAPGLQLFSSDSRNGKFRQVANYKRKLDEFGRARSRLKNIPGGCFQVRMRAEKDVSCKTNAAQPTTTTTSVKPMVIPAPVKPATALIGTKVAVGQATTCVTQPAVFSNILCEGDPNPASTKRKNTSGVKKTS